MEIRIEKVEPLHVYAMSSGPAPIPREQIPPVTYRLFDLLAGRLIEIGVEPPETGVAWYERMTGEFGEHSQRVWVGYIVEGNAFGEISPVVLDGAENVAVGIHYGPMAGIRESWNELFDWVHEHGGHSAGYAREVHVKARPLPEEQWVTRLELPFE
ncbi:GyrI-like domain-containing protein [Gryllotalpicola reticulitermitis]|uniref:GyrI-like domain-containing protein n=1 Tax=Gryllotalpicola reticulitermitis TaxID=1184153 RepID=A0ABV8Q2Z8_9MICO